MKHWLWKLLRKGFWLKLNSHYKDKDGNEKYAEWEQRKWEIRNHRYYQIAGNNGL